LTRIKRTTACRKRLSNLNAEASCLFYVYFPACSCPATGHGTDRSNRDTDNWSFCCGTWLKDAVNVKYTIAVGSNILHGDWKYERGISGAPFNNIQNFIAYLKNPPLFNGRRYSKTSMIDHTIPFCRIYGQNGIHSRINFIKIHGFHIHRRAHKRYRAMRLGRSIGTNMCGNDDITVEIILFGLHFSQLASTRKSSYRAVGVRYKPYPFRPSADTP